MTMELSKNLYAIIMRNGIEIWVEKEKADKLQNELLTGSGSRFIVFEDNTFNTADIVGIFPALAIENLTRRKNGGWQCEFGNWHGRGEKCECLSEKEQIEKEKIREGKKKQYEHDYGSGVEPL